MPGPARRFERFLIATVQENASPIVVIRNWQPE